MAAEDQIKKLEDKLKKYEQNGAAKMYYAINRKMNEIGDLFNSTSLEGISLDDAKDKSFDRIFKLIEKAETVANAAKSLKEFGGITGNEKEDVDRRPFNDRLAEDRS